MKVYLSKPKDHWVSPYTIIKYICFWEKDDSVFYNHENLPDAPYDKWIDRLSYVSNAIKWVWDKVDPEIKVIKIDYWDTWSMDITLSPIILPMLKQLKADKHGSPQVDVEDVPFALQHEGYSEWDDQLQLDFGDKEQFHTESWEITHKRWDWVMDEMIWTFEQLHPDNDWEAQYTSGVFDTYSEVCKRDENGKALLFQMKNGPNHTYKVDWDARNKHQERINNGLRLFGKYYQGLWD